MLKKVILFLICFCFYRSYCQPSIYEYALNGGTITKQNFSIKIPFSLNDNNLIVLHLNLGGDKVDFIFDTAAGTSVINKETYAKSNAHLLGRVDVRDGNGQLNPLEIVEYDSVYIGELRLSKLPFVVSDMTKNFGKISGIIGANIINKLNWYIDYDNYEITITDNPIINKQTLISKINVGYNDNIPFATLKVGDNVIGECLFDFGFTMGINIPKHIFNNIDTKNTNGIEVYKYITQRQALFENTGTDTVSLLKIKKTLKLSKFTIPEIEIYASNVNFLLAGQAFFQQYNIGIDSRNMCYYLFERKKKSEIKDDDGLFFPLVFEWVNKKVKITLIRFCSSAHNKGISIGDEVVSINNVMVDKFSQSDDFYKWLRKEGEIIVQFNKKSEPMTFVREKIKPSKECEK